MIIDCISDLHGYYPNLPGGDILIIAGDLTANDSVLDYLAFDHWLSEQVYQYKLIIAGNHDTLLEKEPGKHLREGPRTYYLEDSGTTIYGINFWGTPWTPWFKGVNPRCKAFMKKERELAKKWALMPNDTDVLITHGPPKGMLDEVDATWFDEPAIHVGSQSLFDRVKEIKPKYHIFGHIHEHGECIAQDDETMYYNCSHVNEAYEPLNQFMRIHYAI